MRGKQVERRRAAAKAAATSSRGACLSRAELQTVGVAGWSG
jgi:hypothetical protein